MYLEIFNEDQNVCEIIEIQAELQNIEQINCTLDREKVVLDFEKFYLEGKKVEKGFTILERRENVICKIGHVTFIYLFDKPPIFRN